MNIIEVIAQDIFDKVRSRFSNLEMGNENGGVTNEPKDARFFDFDFAIEGNNLGRVSISINERGALKLYYSQGILENSDSITQGLWYDFLKEMRFFSKRRMMRFDTRDITKGNLDKSDFQYLATTGSKEKNMNESSKMYGTPHKSYRKLENTRLIVKHSKAVDEGTPGSRSRNIEALFIENQDGERFKYPFIHLAGAKAMQRHVANGGFPYDPAGKAIIGLSEKIAQLSAFKRHASRHDGLNQESHDIIERANMKLESLKKECEMLSRQGYYEAWKENFVPVEESAEIDEVTLEDYKSKFTVKHFDESLLDIFPLLHSIMQETSEINLNDLVSETQTTEVETSEKSDPFNAFESWADSLVEGRLPSETVSALGDLLNSGLEMGGFDALGAIQALQEIGIRNEELEELLKAEAKINPNAAPAESISKWLETFDPQSAQELFGQGQEPAQAPEQDAEQNAAEGTVDDTMDNEEPTKQKLNTREIAEVVKSFYDRETGKFPRGETGVVTHCRKMFGDKGAKLAERLVSHLTQKGEEQSQESAELDEQGKTVRSQGEYTFTTYVYNPDFEDWQKSQDPSVSGDDIPEEIEVEVSFDIGGQPVSATRHSPAEGHEIDLVSVDTADGVDILDRLNPDTIADLEDKAGDYYAGIEGDIRAHSQFGGDYLEDLKRLSGLIK